jgi:hypothetical protein
MGWPTNYDGWIARVKKWLDVTDLDDDVFGFCLDSANERLNRDLSSQWMESTTDYIVEDPTEAIQLQYDVKNYNRMRLVTIRGSQPLVVVALNEFKNESISNTGTTPRVYCISGMNLLIWPPANTGDVIDIDYYVKVPALDKDQDENVFSIRHPDALLYASLLEATPFIAEDERIPTWSAFYRDIQAAINATADKATKGSTPLKREIKVM